MGATTVRSPQFTRGDLELAVAWQMEKALTCAGCGQPRDESMSKDRQFSYQAQPLRCHACAARDREVKQFTAGPHDPAGLMFSVSSDE